MRYFFISLAFISFCGFTEEYNFQKIIERLEQDDFEMRQQALDDIRLYSQSQRWALMKVLVNSKDAGLQAVAGMIEDTLPVPFEMFRGALQSGRTGESALLTSAKMLNSYIRAGSCSEDLKTFLARVDFTKQCVLIYNFCHSGSGMDISALKTTYGSGVITCEVYDACNMAMRTCDLHISDHFFVLIIDKVRVRIVNVIDGMGQTQGREYILELKDASELDRAARSIKGFAPYKDWWNERIKNAEELKFFKYDLSEGDYRHLRALPNLRKIGLSGTNVTAEKLMLLKDHPFLNAFDLSGSIQPHKSSITDDCLRELTPAVEFLDFSFNDVSYKGFQYLKTIQRLRTLRFRQSGIDGIKESPEGLHAIAEILSLQELDISNVWIDPEFIADLGKLKNLKSLKITLNAANVDQCIAQLENLGSLTHLDIECADLENRHLKTIGSLKNLTYLNLDHFNKISDDGLAFLIPLRKLQALSLGYCKIGDEGLKHLMHLPIRRLDLRGTEVTDSSVYAIAEHFEKIEDLNLRYAGKVTKNGVFALRKMKMLKYLNPLASFSGLSVEDEESAFLGLEIYSHDEGLYADSELAR